MNPLRASVLVLLLGTVSPAVLAASAAPSGGYVDGAMFRALVDDSKDIVEVDIDGSVLHALASSADDDHGKHQADQSKDIFAKLKSIHAVIGTVKGPAEEALALVQKTDQKLVASGWQRITRISDGGSKISVLTHTVNDHIDGLVALIFDSGDKELVFANLAGEIDINQLGAIGKRFNVPGLDQVVPGSH